jgi:hypothetical protein
LTENREQNCCQDRDYRDHYQQFNQGEADTKTNLKVASPNCPNSILPQHLTSLLFSPLLGLRFPPLILAHFFFCVNSLLWGGVGNSSSEVWEGEVPAEPKRLRVVNGE